MGECFITRKSGASLRRLVLVTPPLRTTYVSGANPDLSGAVIAADVGGQLFALDKSAYNVTPAVIASGTTAINVSYTLNRVTKTLDIPITVFALDATFGNNTWEAICLACELGAVPSGWAVGAEKSVSVAGVSHTLRLIGKNHDTLSPDDPLYMSYNGGSRKVALTLQFITPMEPVRYNTLNRNAWVGWHKSNMRTNELAALAGTLPAEIKLRTVVKRTGVHRYEPTPLPTDDKLFLLSPYEIAATPGANWPSEEEASACSVYQYYANGGTPPYSASSSNWLRSIHYNCQYDTLHQMLVSSSGRITSSAESQTTAPSLPYYPALCI